MLCPFCMLEYSLDAPCFCHAAVHISPAPPSPVKLDVVPVATDFNVAVLATFDPATVAPYLGA